MAGWLCLSGGEKGDGAKKGISTLKALDLNLVLGNWNQSVTPFDQLMGDPSGEGLVGIAGLNFVLGNWNADVPPVAAGPAVVPEPGVLVVLVGGGMVALARRSARRRV